MQFTLRLMLRPVGLLASCCFLQKEVLMSMILKDYSHCLKLSLQTLYQTICWENWQHHRVTWLTRTAVGKKEIGVYAAMMHVKWQDSMETPVLVRLLFCPSPYIMKPRDPIHVHVIEGAHPSIIPCICHNQFVVTTPGFSKNFVLFHGHSSLHVY